MNCKRCRKPIRVSEEALVSTDQRDGKEYLDLQIGCPECGCDHFTFIAVEDLCSDGDRV